MRGLSAKLMDPQRGEQAEHGVRVPESDLGERGMLIGLAIGECVETAPYPDQLSLFAQRAECDAVAAAHVGLQIPRAQEAPRACKIKDGGRRCHLGIIAKRRYMSTNTFKL